MKSGNRFIFPGALLLIFGVVIILGFFLTQTMRTSKGSEQAVEQQNEPVATLEKQTMLVPTAAAYAYPGFTDNPDPTSVDDPYPLSYGIPTLTPAPMPTDVILPPLSKYKDPGPFKDMLLMYSFTDGDSSSYWVSKFDGTSQQRFAPAWWSQIKIDQLDFSVAPDGSKILYTLYSGMEIADHDANSIWISDPTGNNPVNLVRGTDDWNPQEAIWSPDGTQIAYRRHRYTISEGVSTNFELWIMNIQDRSERKVFTQDKGVNIFGGQLPLFHWYRNGYIYFSPSDERSAIIAVNPQSGAAYDILDNFDPLQLRTILSPDGIHIVFNSTGQSNYHNQANYVLVEIPGAFIGWSANGKQVIYKTGNASGSKIVIEDVETRQKKEIVFDRVVKIFAVSPDAKFLAFVEGDDLYIHDIEKNKDYLIKKGNASEKPGESSFSFRTWIPVR